MSVARFEPIGEKARWRMIYDILQHKPTGSVVSYEELGAHLGLDPREERHTIQLSMRRAAKHSETEDKRALEPVPNKGYRIVEAEEHLRLARGHEKRAGRALSRGHSKVTNVDLSGMEPEVRKAFETVATAFSMQMDMLKRTNVRQGNLEKLLSSIDERTGRSEEEINELRRRLERLEKPRSANGEDPVNG